MRWQRKVFALAWLCACGGSGGVPVIEDLDAGGDATTGGGDATVPGDGSSRTDASGGGDATDATANDGTADSGGDAPADAATDAPSDAADAGARDTGVVSDPNAIECGTAKCDTTTQLCCVSGIVLLDAGTRTRTCVDAGPLACVGGASQQCDEAADCKNNEVCCARLTADGVETACVAQQTGCVLGVQMCATDKECGQGVQCYPQTCGTRVVGFCGVADAGSRCP